MARLNILFCLSLFIFPFIGNAQTDCPFIGKWKFTKIRYDGVVQPRPNPTLHLYFEFDSSGTDRLYWTREGEKTYCERKAQFRCTPEFIHELVVWVNPNNSFECQKDPDMKLGQQIRSVYKMVDGNFETELGLGDKTITYIWEKY